MLEPVWLLGREDNLLGVGGISSREEAVAIGLELVDKCRLLLAAIEPLVVAVDAEGTRWLDGGIREDEWKKIMQ